MFLTAVHEEKTVMDSDLDSCLSYQPFKMLSWIIRKAMFLVKSRLVDTRTI